MFFIEQVYAIAGDKLDKITFKDREVDVTPILKKECRMLKIMHSLLVGSGTIFAVLIAETLGSKTFWSDMFYIILTLVLVNVILDRLSYFLLNRRAKRG